MARGGAHNAQAASAAPYGAERVMPMFVERWNFCLGRAQMEGIQQSAEGAYASFTLLFGT